MTDFNEVKDSGQRQEFTSGAVRDSRNGKGRYDLVLSFTHMILRLARHFENGAVKYGDDNWRKGLPLRRFIDSAFRHLCQYINGKTDEDHLTAAIWNLLCHGETANEIETGRLPASLDDMPHYGTNLPLVQKLQRVRTVTEVGEGEPVEYVTKPNKPTVYIAGPMRGYKQLNFPMFDAAKNYLLKRGFNVISPADLDREHGIDPINDPDSVERANQDDPNLTQTCVQRDSEKIIGLDKDSGDGLVLLPGWEKSVGARAEVALALWLELKFWEYIPGYGGISSIIPERTYGYIESKLFYQEPF